MDAEHILEHMRFLHSDVAKQTLAILERLEHTAQIVDGAAARAEKALVAQRPSPLPHSREVAIGVDGKLQAFFELQVARLEQIAATVKISATEVNTGRTVLHKQNEAFLMNRVAEIVKLIEKLADFQNEIIAAAQQQADTVVSPVISQLSQQIERSGQRDSLSIQTLKKTMDIHASLASDVKAIVANMKLAILAALVVAGLLFFGGFYFGKRSNSVQKFSESPAITSSENGQSFKSAGLDQSPKT